MSLGTEMDARQLAMHVPCLGGARQRRRKQHVGSRRSGQSLLATPVPFTVLHKLTGKVGHGRGMASFISRMPSEQGHATQSSEHLAIRSRRGANVHVLGEP